MQSCRRLIEHIDYAKQIGVDLRCQSERCSSPGESVGVLRSSVRYLSPRSSRTVSLAQRSSAIRRTTSAFSGADASGSATIQRMAGLRFHTIVAGEFAKLSELMELEGLAPNRWFMPFITAHTVKVGINGGLRPGQRARPGA